MLNRPNDAPQNQHDLWLRFAGQYQLTPAELRAVQLLVGGNLSDKQIAAALGRTRWHPRLGENAGATDRLHR